MRNDLLADIVIAAGGVVTNKGNRNALLQDWLNAVESEPVINYVARLDGTQYYELSEAVTISLGGALELDFYSEVTGWQTVVSGFTDQNGGRVGEVRRNNTDETIELIGDLSGFDYYIDGDQITSRVTPFPLQKITRLRVVNSSSELLKYRVLAERDSSTTSSARLVGYIKRFRVYDSSGVLINEIPLTNKAQGATQLPTAGNVSATMVNYSEDVWEEV